MTRFLVSSLLAGSALALLSEPAMAQDTPPASNEQAQADAAAPSKDEIVVTAQRRKERVVEVPISISVVDSAQLERQQVNSVNDLNRVAPSLEIQAAPGQNTGGGGAIRGIGTQTFNQGAAASVGIVVDQVSQGNANIADLFDISRVEVLKGPQGTLFGLTTSAGVINITTNAPDPRAVSAQVRTELSAAGFAGSEYGNQIVQGMVNMPISGDAALRVSGIANFRQGPGRNAFDSKYNELDRFGGRARILWEPTNQLRFDVIGDYAVGTTERGGDFFTFVKTAGPGEQFFAGVDPIGITARLASCGVTPSEGNRSFCSKDEARSRNYNYGLSFNAEYDAGPFTLTSITAYRGSIDKGRGPASNIFRADPLILEITAGDAHTKTDLFTQEFRVTSRADQVFEYTAGAFYSHQTTNADPSTFNITLHLFPGVDIPAVRSLGAQNDVADESLAVFGQSTIHVTSAFRLIAGGRFTGERLSLDGTNLGPPAYSYRQTYNSEVVSYRFGAQYDVARRTMLYATASRGYKGGQITLPTDPTQPPGVLLAEIPTAYEAGLKSTLFRGWIADLSIFYQKIHNFQAQQCLSNPATGSLSCSSSNIDGVKSRGAELSFFGHITRDLSLNTGFVYTKATYPDGFIGTDGTDIGNTQLAYAPEYKFTLSGEYETSLSERLKGYVGGDAVWKSRIRYEANSIAESTYRPHWTVGGRIGVRTSDDRYAISVFARNLFNVHEPILLQSGFPYNGADNIGAIYGPQSFRQVGLQLEGKF
jgi:iron complex outermembrane receptor protein